MPPLPLVTPLASISVTSFESVLYLVWGGGKTIEALLRNLLKRDNFVSYVQSTKRSNQSAQAKSFPKFSCFPEEFTTKINHLAVENNTKPGN